MDQTFQRADEVLAADLDDEIVLYDTRTHQAHRLDAAATRVWAQLAGQVTVPDLARLSSLPEAHVVCALEQLEQLGLLAQPGSSNERLGRREALARAGKIAVGAIGLPTIASVAMPAMAAAASAPNTNDTGGGQGGASQPPTGLTIQKGTPPSSAGGPGRTHSAGGTGYYGLPSRNSNGYYAGPGVATNGSFALPGQPVSNADLGGAYSYIENASGGNPGGNYQCLYSSRSTPCAQYYGNVPGATAVCASYGNPYVCNGSRHP